MLPSTAGQHRVRRACSMAASGCGNCSPPPASREFRHDDQDGGRHRHPAEEAFLLPWYVNGTLDAEDRRRVRGSMAEWAEVEELELLRSVGSTVVTSTDALPEPDADGFARLMARASTPSRSAPAGRQSRGGFAARIAQWMQMSWKPAMAAAAVVIAVQATAIVALVGDRTGGDSAPPRARPRPPGRGALLVGFADGAALADIRSLLERADAVVVKGPTADGYFIVAAQGCRPAPRYNRPPIW